MSDRYQSITNSPVGAVTSRLGLPTPPLLRRHEPGMPVVDGPIVTGEAQGGRLLNPAAEVMRSFDAHVISADEVGEETGPAALVFDASGIDSPERLRALYDFFHPTIRSLRPNGRLLVLAGVVDEADGVPARTAQRALEGFTRSAAKEIGNKGSTAQLVRVSNGAEKAMESTLRFLLSARSAFVDGQVIEISSAPNLQITPPGDWDQPLSDRIAVVTGAARGIGASIAETMARDGAHVVCVDVPAAGEDLTAVSNRVGGESLQLDITADDAGERLASHISDRHGRLDALVHNAGITRDKTLGRMEPEQWDSVLAVNLASQLAINAELSGKGLIAAGSRVVTVSSVSGIAGNRGQSNYATSKAGVIGMVEAMAPEMAGAGATVNAVAPGFIETKMTEAMPVGMREAGRRTSSLVQGGQPVDVAETVAWLAGPASGGVNGNVVRVCGQALIGA